MKCAICGEDYYYQTQTDPEEPCWCGEMAPRIFYFRDRIKKFRFRIASMILKCSEWIVDKLTQREI